MHRRRLTRVSLLALAAVLGLTSCSGSGPVQAKPAPQASSALCSKVAGKWPKTVAKQKSRDTTAKSDSVRAWGDPAIIARCGVATPGPTTDLCSNVDGIDWVVRQLKDGSAFVTFGRTPAIEVLVPKTYEQPDVIAFTDAAEQIPQGPRRCTSPADS